MRNQIFPILCILLFFGGCKKKQGIEALPEATQIGSNTLGCLINGKALVPKPFAFFTPSGTTYEHSNGKYHFNLYIRRVDGKLSQSVDVRSFDMKLEERTYLLMRRSYDRSISGSYSTYIGNVSTDYETSPSLQGELRITKLDSVKGIIAGTFWFDAETKDGKRVEVREGRFDSKY